MAESKATAMSYSKNGATSIILEFVMSVVVVLLMIGLDRVRRRRRQRERTDQKVSQPLVQGGAIEHTCQTAPLAPKQDDEFVRLVETLHTCIKSGNLDGAHDALKHLAGLGKATPDEYRVVIMSYVKQDQPEVADMWLCRAEEQCGSSLSKTACYNAVMNAFAKKGDVAQALAVATRMISARVAFDTVSYNTLIDTAARAGDADGAETWMRRMLAEGVKPSVISFSSVMRACALAGKPRNVDIWFEKADKLGIELNTISYSAVINAFTKREDFVSANGWLNIMVARGVPASAHCFTALLHSLLRNDELRQAIELVEKIRAAGVELDAPIYNLLVSGAMRLGELDIARSWAQEAVDAGIKLARGPNRLARYDRLRRSNLAEPGQTTTESHEVATSPKPAQEDAEVDPKDMSECVGKRFDGLIKEYVAAKFGYISCPETHGVFKRDVFLSPQENSEGFGKGQRVTFRLELDKVRGLPRAFDLLPVQLR